MIIDGDSRRSPALPIGRDGAVVRGFSPPGRHVGRPSMLNEQDKRAEGSLAERVSMLVFVFGSVMLALSLVVQYYRLVY
jgi:hypothetical protein